MEKNTVRAKQFVLNFQKSSPRKPQNQSYIATIKFIGQTTVTSFIRFLSIVQCVKTSKLPPRTRSFCFWLGCCEASGTMVDGREMTLLTFHCFTFLPVCASINSRLAIPLPRAFTSRELSFSSYRLVPVSESLSRGESGVQENFVVGDFCFCFITSYSSLPTLQIRFKKSHFLKKNVK